MALPPVLQPRRIPPRQKINRLKIPQAGVRRRAELLYQQLDGLQALRRDLRPEFLAESRKHKAAKLLRQIPCIGPIRAARLIALIQTPHRLRSKRQLWTYSGPGIETHDNAQFRFVRGQLQRSRKPQQLRGLNRNHNHEMKEIFTSTATRASWGAGPFHDFYEGNQLQGEEGRAAYLVGTYPRNKEGQQAEVWIAARRI